MRLFFIIVTLLISLEATENTINDITVSEKYYSAGIYMRDYTIRGNGEECTMTYEVNDNLLIHSKCKTLVNSKGTKIHCTKNKKICKTQQEVDIVVSHFSSNNKEKKEVRTNKVNNTTSQVKPYSNINESVPGKDFFRGTFSAAHPMGFVNVSDDALPLYNHFATLQVKWEKAGSTQWVARLRKGDPLSKRTNETAILFIREDNSLFMVRVLINDIYEASRLEVYQLAERLYGYAINNKH